ncbi:hypothetical protein BJV82DRAFT_708410 [Fennellomyces sp. T-0311]|nr:hypothetical protein BJV82DRAFT_708410 [Fennellomyces sp. T-0311]
MYVHRNEKHPYSCTMISPSAPPIAEEFFYPTSTSTNSKEDHDRLQSDNSSTTYTNSSYHTGMLAPSAPYAESQTDEEFTTHNTSRQEREYESTPPPPYQMTAPLLAAAEDGNETTHSSTDNAVEYGKFISTEYYYYTPSRKNSFSPFCFAFSLLFFILGLAQVLGSVVIKHHCQKHCDVSERTSDEYIASPDCPDFCFSILGEILRDGGATVTAVAGFAAVCQLFILSMWQMYTCSLPC